MLQEFIAIGIINQLVKDTMKYHASYESAISALMAIGFSEEQAREKLTESVKRIQTILNDYMNDAREISKEREIPIEEAMNIAMEKLK